MKTLKVAIVTLAISALLGLGSLGVQAQEPANAKLKLVPVPAPGGAAQQPDLVTAISKVAESTLPAVVLIQVTERQEVPNPMLPYENNPFFRRFFNLPKKMPKKFEKEIMGLGSGMIVSPDGLILSNNHVVGGATEIKVLLSSGDEYSAKLVGTDPLTDLGVIKISAGKSLPCVTFGDSDDVKVGQWVVAIGQPRGLEQSVTQGIVSAKHRTGITNPSSYQDFLQTDAAINPGNSGGPLLTLTGQVIGVNSAIASQSGGFEGIGFAIPSKMAVHVANALIANGKVVRGWLGVGIQEVTPALASSLGLPAPRGALIGEVMKAGPAAEAGIKKGDVILQYEGVQVADASALRNMVAGTAPGKDVKLELWRDKKSMEMTVKIGNLEDLGKKLAAVVKDRLGAEVAPVTEEEAQKYGLSAAEGVQIVSVDPNGPLGKAGFEQEDLILAVNKEPVLDVNTFASIIEALPHDQKVKLLALDHRTGNTGYILVEVN
jgi:serine protease Do